MKAYIKHKFIPMCLFFGLLATSSIAHDTASYDLECYIKIRSFSETAQNVLQMYREIGATPSQAAALYVPLAFLGHPSYPAISKDDNVSVFIYSSLHDSKRKYIILAKLQDGANLKKVIEGLGWSAEEYAGWTFFAKNKEDFQVIGDKNLLVRSASQEVKKDIEFRLKPSAISFIKLCPDKDLIIALSNVDNSVWNLELPEGKILIEGDLTYKKEGYSLASWLEKYGNRWGLNSKILHHTSKDSKVQISLERKEMPNFFDQWRSVVLSQDK